VRWPTTNNETSAAARASTLAAAEIGTARYHIHRPLLEKHSEYFKKALNGPWKESQEGAVKLEDVECGVCKCQGNENRRIMMAIEAMGVRDLCSREKKGR
jgi:hypothetical protein